MGKRILTGVVGVPLIIFCIFGPQFMMYILTCVIMGMLHYEMEQMQRKDTGVNLLIFDIINFIVSVLLYFFVTENLAFLLTVLITLVILETIFVYPFISVKEAYFLVFSNLYCSWLPLHILKVHQMENGAWLLMGAFILVWVCDSGAYFSGRFMGKHKMSPKLSPNKTIEGALGGIAITIVVGVILQHFVFISLSTYSAAILSGIIAIAAIIGDLFESYLKRSYGVKDSGNILPGHGGFADRFDSFIIVIPLYFYFFQWMMQ